MSSEPTSVFLIESSDDTRALVAGVLEGSGLIRVVGTAADLSGAAIGIGQIRPDVVIVDRFPGSDLAGGGHCVVIHTATVLGRTATELREAGICAVVFKEVGMLDDLIDAVVRAPADRRRSSPPVHRM